MDKEKQIEEMSKVLYAPQLEEKNDGYGELCGGCRKWYEDEPCKEKHKCDYYTSIANHLQEAGYGNVKRAVKEFADELKRRFMKHYPTAYKDAIYQFTDVEIDELIKERFGEEE